MGSSNPAIIRKVVDHNPDPAVDDLEPEQGWSMTANVAPTPASWVLPTGASGSMATGTTGPDGYVNFQWTNAAPVSSAGALAAQAAALDRAEADGGAAEGGLGRAPAQSQDTIRRFAAEQKWGATSLVIDVDPVSLL